ncbi:hypothetical protein LP422_01860 [Janibacter limosus]|uniref:Uncharacterized protein n=1 Tax=Janibacter limosus TaxID=53458 RepID=A0AC61U5G8_9MICO|nr:hypothetical protein [Janibacter limosus]UUZ45096.1 hypothetical protein LP422_01860 [Janibacter limosus]
MADADESRCRALVAVLGAEPDLEVTTPAATLVEVASTPATDVVVLLGGLDVGRGPLDVLRHPRRRADVARIVLMHDVGAADELLGSGAHGCVADSSTPLQIGAAIRAAARGEVAETDQPVTGPLVQRVRREVPPLTDREVEVLRLVAAGLGNRGDRRAPLPQPVSGEVAPVAHVRTARGAAPRRGGRRGASSGVDLTQGVS